MRLLLQNDGMGAIGFLSCCFDALWQLLGARSQLPVNRRVILHETPLSNSPSLKEKRWLASQHAQVCSLFGMPSLCPFLTHTLCDPHVPMHVTQWDAWLRFVMSSAPSLLCSPFLLKAPHSCLS